MRQSVLHIIMLALLVTAGCAATGSMDSGAMDDNHGMMMETGDKQEMMMEPGDGQKMMMEDDAADVMNETDGGINDKIKMEMQ